MGFIGRSRNVTICVSENNSVYFKVLLPLRNCKCKKTFCLLKVLLPLRNCQCKKDFCLFKVLLPLRNCQCKLFSRIIFHLEVPCGEADLLKALNTSVANFNPLFL